MIKWKKFPYIHNLAFVSFIGILLSIINALWAFLLSIAETENGNFVVVSLSMAERFCVFLDNAYNNSSMVLIKRVGYCLPLDY